MYAGASAAVVGAPALELDYVLRPSLSKIRDRICSFRSSMKKEEYL
jgi:hypothetical protein